MPQTNGTRKNIAADVLRTLEQGPTLFPFDAQLNELAQKNYQLWVNTWVLPQLRHVLEPKPAGKAQAESA